MIFYLCLVWLMCWGLIYKTKNNLSFLLSLEVLMILISLYCFFWGIMYFLVILLMGVLEAIIGLSFMILYIRYFGSDYLMYM